MNGNSLTERETRKLKTTFSNFMNREDVKAKIRQMLPGKAGERLFVMSIISAVANNPALAECDHMTILSAALTGESLKLSHSVQLGHYYLVPFNDNKNGRKVAMFQLGYKGYIQLAIRSGHCRKLNVIAVKEGELEKFDALNEEIKVNLIEDEEERENAKTIGYYAMFEYVNGFRKAMYWTKKKMEAHALRYSKGYAAKKGYTFWEKDFDGMAYKTMLRQLIGKWAMTSVDIAVALEIDQSEISENGEPIYVDNLAENTENNLPAGVMPYEAAEDNEKVKDEFFKNSGGVDEFRSKN